MIIDVNFKQLGDILGTVKNDGTTYVFASKADADTALKQMQAIFTNLIFKQCGNTIILIPTDLHNDIVSAIGTLEVQLLRVLRMMTPDGPTKPKADELLKGIKEFLL